MEHLTTKTREKLEEIKEILISEKVKGNSLFDGRTGELLFLFHYYYYVDQQEKVLSFAYHLMNEVFESLSNEHFSFSSGYAGIGWFLEYCTEKNWLEINTNEVLEDVDKMVYQLSIYELQKGNYDFLHGAMGGGLYFLSRSGSPLREAFMEALVLGLEEIAEEESCFVKWPFYNFSERTRDLKTFNLGMSHGIPSIVAFLSLLSKEGIHEDVCYRLAKKAIDFIESNEIDFNQFNCHFPNSIREGVFQKSRLAWCYGDLGLTCGLYHFSNSDKNQQSLLSKKIQKILDNNADRRNLLKNKVWDAGLCHGASGIAHIFNKMYKRIGKNQYREAAEYWLKQTLLFASFDDGLAGFKAYDSVKDIHYNNRGFLEGISGIGLALISFLKREELDWDRALLIS